MKFADDFQLASSLSAADIERTQAWLREVMTAFERKESNITGRFISPGATAQVGSLGTISGPQGFEQLFAWIFSATEGGHISTVLKSLQLARDSLSVVVEGECVYANGSSERFSWRSIVRKELESDKLTGATVTDTGAAPDIFAHWCKKTGPPSFVPSLQ